MKAMAIRKLEEEDLGQVAALEQEIFSDPWSLAGFREELEGSGRYYLAAEECGQVVGYCGYHAIAGEGHIYNVAVQQQFRGKGIGRKLVEAMLRHGEEQGIFDFTLEVRAGNEVAIRLYESLGFQTEGIRKNFYQKPTEHALIMWRHKK